MANPPSANGHVTLGSEVIVAKHGHPTRSRRRSQQVGAPATMHQPIDSKGNAQCDNMFEPVC
jgi:hypothetical protein